MRCIVGVVILEDEYPKDEAMPLGSVNEAAKPLDTTTSASTH